MKKTFVGFLLAVALISSLCCQAFAATSVASGTTNIVVNKTTYGCTAWAYIDRTNERGYTEGHTIANVSRTHTAVYVTFKTVSDGQYVGSCSMVDRGSQSGTTRSLYANCPYDVDDFVRIQGNVIFRGTLSKDVKLLWVNNDVMARDTQE